MSEERKTSELTADGLLDSIRSTISTSEISAGTRKLGSGGDAAANPSAEDTPPLVAAEARESIGESFAALTKAAQIEHGSWSGAPKEHIMNTIPAEATIRPLSQIEKDLIAAEGQFSDAEARRKQAEADARAALDGINKYQAEVDAAIDRLRKMSPTGSNWSRQADGASNVLTLKEEAPNTNGDPILRPNFSYSTKT